MPTETKSHEKPANAAPVREPVTNSRSASARAVFLGAAGNLAIQRLANPRVQRKARASVPGDAYEEEADRVSQSILALTSAPMVQRKCGCGGEGECDECKRKSENHLEINRKTNELYVQRASYVETAPGPVASTGGSAAEAGGWTASVAAPVATPGLIVEDSTTDLGVGQMKKSEFLGQLRGSVTGAAQAALAGTPWSTLGSVAIGPWFQYYAGQSAQQLERTIQRSVPGSAGVTNASAYIPMVSARVQSAVGEWARTGALPPDVPASLPGIDLSGGGLLGTIGGAVSLLAEGASNVVSNIGGMLFKSKEGGARVADDPRAIQAQLGSGEGLESGLQGGMSSAFGYDFSGVRVHKDNQAAQLSADLNARAFTIGHNVAFGAGEYQPGTLIGDALIAHELAHVVQQGGATVQGPLQKGEADIGSLEEDADVSAVRAVASLWSGAKAGLANIGHNAIPALKSGLKLQRCKRESTPAPQEKFNLPAGENLLSAPGEQIVFSSLFVSTRWTDFKTSYTAEGGHFYAPGGPQEKEFEGAGALNLPFFIDSSWDGATPVSVHMKIRRVSDSTIVILKDWKFSNKPYVPTSIRQWESEGEEPLAPGEVKTFLYMLGPEVGTDGKPRSYQGQTIRERFEAETCNISPSELKAEFKVEHPQLTSPEQIARFFFDDLSWNASFTVDRKARTSDAFMDQNAENNVSRAWPALKEALVPMKEVYFDKPQIFEAKPGVPLGRYIIRRILKPNGQMAMKKFKD